MERAPETCILCGSLSRLPMIQKDGWSVYKCGGCGLGVLDPRPDRKELAQIYEKAYFDSHYGGRPEVGSSKMTQRIAQENHRVAFFRKFRKEGLVIDVGCGMGYFLYAAQKFGYAVEGVDISNHAAAYVRDALKIPLKIGHLDFIDFPERSADVITMWHFLEHTDNPRQYIKKVSRWLKPDGLLVIDVPNYEGTDAKKKGSDWADWDLPHHLYHFTPDALTLLLSQHGFDIIRKKKYHSEVIKERLQRVPVVSLLARIIAKAYSGNSFAVVAKKKVF